MRRQIICGIYKITSPTGRVYIGKSIDIYSRWTDYKKPYCVNSGLQPLITKSFKKYGCNNHVFEIIEECCEEKLNEREIYWIERYGSYGNKTGLNCSPGGDGHGVGVPLSDETKEKIRQSKIGKYVGEKNPNYGKGVKGEKNPLFGKPKSKEVTEKNRLSNKLTWDEIVKSDWYNSEEQKLKRQNAAKIGLERKKNCPIYNSPEAKQARIDRAAHASKISAIKKRAKYLLLKKQLKLQMT